MGDKVYCVLQSGFNPLPLLLWREGNQGKSVPCVPLFCSNQILTSSLKSRTITWSLFVKRLNQSVRLDEEGNLANHLNHRDYSSITSLKFYYPKSWQVFTGNSNRHSIVYHDFVKQFKAVYVRIYPRSWYGWMSMRTEIYGCYGMLEFVLRGCLRNRGTKMFH